MTSARLAYEVTGAEDAPVLVLANSLGTTWALWDAQVAALTERFRLLRYNHRGHLDSQVPPGPYTIEDLSEDLLALLDDLRIESFMFCGLSIGGMVGMWLAAHAPDRVSRLALCCTSARISPPSLWHDRAAQVRAHGTASISDAVVSRWFTPAFPGHHRNTVERAFAMLAATPAEGYAGCCEAIAGTDLHSDLSAIKAPTLVIAGEQDLATPVEHAEQIVAGIAGSRLVEVPDAAHLASIEQPETVTRLLLEHFSAGEGR